MALPGANNGTAPTIVIGFGDKVVALEGIEISLGEAGAGSRRPLAVDVLVSQLSPRAGFQSVRSDPLQAVAGVQKFAFSPVAARWVMLKFTAGADPGAVALAELRLTGHDGPPQTRYRFNESPARAFDVLRQLEDSSALKLSISADEQSLFADAADGRLDQWSFAEAALIASGVVQASERKPYLAQIDRIEVDARKAVAKAKEPFAQGAVLLKSLHAGPLAKGYRANQTRVSTVLDAKQFNCVSSAALYNIIGRRLGLDLRAIEVPDHAFSILYDGTDHADVETTTAAGFNPERNPSAKAEFQQLTGFSYIPDSHRDRRREVGEVGLLAIILLQPRRRADARQALSGGAAGLLPGHEPRSGVRLGGTECAGRAGQLERGVVPPATPDEATRIAGIGLRLAPRDAALVNNQKAVWSQWADTLTRDGKHDEALSVLRRADREVPQAGFGKMQAWVFLREGEDRIKAGDWAKAAAIAGPALARELDPAARDEIAAWAADVPLRWSQHELRRGDFGAALDVLAARLAAPPPDRRIGDQIAYVVQEQLRDKAAKEGAEAAEGMIPVIVGRFAQVDAVRQVSIGHLQRAVGRLSEEGRYEAALATAGRMASLSSEPGLETTTKARIYDQWALALAKERKYGPALDVYDKALPVVGDQGHARNNVRFILQEWLKDAGTRDPDGAREILQRELTRFAAVPGVADVGKAHVARRVQELAQQGQYEPALATLQSHAAWIPDATDTAQIAASVFDRWSQSLVAKRDWPAAADVYQRALQQYPKNAHLENNALATWHQWARTFVERKDWSGAIGVYEQALQRFPGNSLLDNNIKYCREQMRKSG